MSSAAPSREGSPAFFEDTSRRRPAVSLSSCSSLDLVPARDDDADGAASVSSASYTAPAHNRGPQRVAQLGAFLEPLDGVRFDDVTEDALAPTPAAHSASVVGTVAMFDAVKGAPVLDAGSVLALRSPFCVVGAVTALLGRVDACSYAVALDAPGLPHGDLAAIRARLAEATPVFSVAAKTNVVGDTAALQVEATDASYVDDVELPAHVRPCFSDDEKEKEWKHRRKEEREKRARLKRLHGRAAVEGDSLSDVSDDDIVDPYLAAQAEALQGNLLGSAPQAAPPAPPLKARRLEDHKPSAPAAAPAPRVAVGQRHVPPPPPPRPSRDGPPPPPPPRAHHAPHHHHVHHQQQQRRDAPRHEAPHHNAQHQHHAPPLPTRYPPHRGQVPPPPPPRGPPPPPRHEGRHEGRREGPSSAVLPLPPGAPSTALPPPPPPPGHHQQRHHAPPPPPSTAYAPPAHARPLPPPPPSARPPQGLPPPPPPQQQQQQQQPPPQAAQPQNALMAMLAMQLPSSLQ